MYKSIKLLLLCIIISSYTSAYAVYTKDPATGKWVNHDHQKQMYLTGGIPHKLRNLKDNRHAERQRDEEARLHAVEQQRQRDEEARLAQEQVQVAKAKRLEAAKTLNAVKRNATTQPMQVAQLEYELELMEVQVAEAQAVKAKKMAKVKRTATKLANIEFLEAIVGSNLPSKSLS